MNKSKKTELLTLKKELLHACMQQVEHRIKNAETAMLAAQESANQEEKSSAGDKYETGRAMSQLDRDRYARQMAEARNELAQLKRIDPGQVHERVGTGSLVGCKHTWYFIAAGLGSIMHQNEKVILLSAASPLARLMAGKKEKDRFHFNGNDFVLDVLV